MDPGSERMTRLLEAVLAVSSDLDLSQVLSRIVRAACELVDAEYGALGVLAADREHLVEFVTHGMSERERETIGDLPHGRGILGLLIRDARPRRVRDITEHPASYGFPPNHPPMHSFLGAPVAIRGRVFGNLYLTNKQSAPEFSEEDQEVVVTLAAAAGVAIDNARLYDRVRRQRGLADALAEMTQHLLEGMETDAALRLMARRSAEMADAELALVALYDEAGRLTVRATNDERPSHALGLELDHDFRWRELVAHREPYLLSSASSVEAIVDLNEIRQLGSLPDGPTAIVAIAVGDAELGVLGVAWASDNDAAARQSLSSLRTFGRTAALALEAGTAQRERGRVALLEDRDRIARDMHDHVIQRLFATGLSLQSTRLMTADAAVSQRLDEAVDAIDVAIKDIREAIFALHRPIGGPGVLAEVAELVRQASLTLGYNPEVSTTGSWGSLTSDIEPELLAVVREALSNLVRHAQANWCRVSVHVTDSAVGVQVEDDGVGIPHDVQLSGLRNLEARAVRLNGSLQLTARQPTGTVLSWRVPIK